MADIRKNIFYRIDWITVSIYLFFILFGVLNIYAATHQQGDRLQLLSMDSRAGKQFVFILAALVLAIVVMIIDSKFWVFLGYPIYGVSILLLILVLVFGREINGAKSWFIIGPVNIQPAEFAKISSVILLSKVLAGFNFSLHKTRDLVISFGILLLPVVLVLLQNDTGSALVYFALVLVLFREGMNETFLVFGVLAIILFVFTLLIPLQHLFVIVNIGALLIAGFRKSSYGFVFAGAAIIGASIGLMKIFNETFNLELFSGLIFLFGTLLSVPVLLLISYLKRIKNLRLIFIVWIASIGLIGSVDYVFNNVLEEHQRSRINQVLGVELDPLGAGYNLNQSKIAIGSGGFSGKGFLKGTQTRFDFVPEQSTDFIFCTVGEEWGFLGSLVLIGLFSFFLIRLIILAERQRSRFSRVFGYGVFSVFFFHFAINIGMTIGLVPVIGIPLPFFSYGGSSLWSFTVLLFIFLHLDTDRFEVVA
jgi:rod shape determining protein RodA